jgi:hypothetical protein
MFEELKSFLKAVTHLKLFTIKHSDWKKQLCPLQIKKQLRQSAFLSKNRLHYTKNLIEINK